MRIVSDCLGTCVTDSNGVHINPFDGLPRIINEGDVQCWVFKDSDVGPFYDKNASKLDRAMTPSELNARVKSEATNSKKAEQKAKERKSEGLPTTSKSRAVSTASPNANKRLNSMREEDSSEQFKTKQSLAKQGIVQGWLGKAKGIKQYLYERGLWQT